MNYDFQSMLYKKSENLPPMIPANNNINSNNLPQPAIDVQVPMQSPVYDQPPLSQGPPEFGSACQMVYKFIE